MCQAKIRRGSTRSIAAGPGSGKAVDREVQQLPTPTYIGLTHTATPSTSTSHARVSSLFWHVHLLPKRRSLFIQAI
ncbi:hypothetical protein BD410DRAFT_846427 [Rickenella mellea]|uniref:Uncharacterized protein n=1 Tax=Rickenella mellea TaxID=50990 RepID=A0A4Y7PFG7_9AGAM|nr:hypothetical protein BD410DRAFT_846427 [Rickenella mellea]